MYGAVGVFWGFRYMLFDGRAVSAESQQINDLLPESPHTPCQTLTWYVLLVLKCEVCLSRTPVASTPSLLPIQNPNNN